MKKYKFLSERKSFKTVESYKTLRTNLMFCGADVKVIVLTSCLPNDGKSYVTQNLAVSLSQVDKKVLIIDADLRKSTMVGKVNVDEDILGLSHYLSGQAELSEVVYQNKEYENLYTIFSGTFPPNPAELLSSEKFRELIKKAREEFDYILIDTPPVGAVIDSAVISAISDGIVMVIRARKTGYKLAQNVQEQLEKTGCRILGAVLNGIDTENKDKYYYKKYYYYSDYNGYYKK